MALTREVQPSDTLTAMTELPYVDILQQEGRALAAAARRNLSAAVPSCPDWTVFDLVEHTGYVHRHIAERVRRKDPDTEERPAVLEAPSDDVGLMEWYEAGLNELVNLLSVTPPHTPAWTWWPPDHTAGFWRRRMAQETAVHRWDAENATSTAQPIASDLAADGVDEFLDIHVPADETPYQGSPGTVHVHRTDGEGEWILTLFPGKMPHVRKGHAKGDVAVRGEASDLLLLMWRRKRPPDVEVIGDRGLVDGLWAYWEMAGN